MVESWLAVAINITWLRSNGKDKKWSVKNLFWDGSKTSNSALDGSPLESRPTLSISSNKITGLFV